MRVQNWKFVFGSQDRFASTERGGRGLWHISWFFVGWVGFFFLEDFIKTSGYKENENLHVNFPWHREFSREPKAMTHCVQSRHKCIYVISRRDTGPGRLGQDLGRISLWVFWLKSTRSRRPSEKQSYFGSSIFTGDIPRRVHFDVLASAFKCKISSFRGAIWMVTQVCQVSHDIIVICHTILSISI